MFKSIVGGKIFMSYTIKEVSEMTKIPASTLRFYDKNGLLPFLCKNESGHRNFTELDLKSLQIIQCLKKTGMSIKEIKKYSDLIQKGDSTLKIRYEMFIEKKFAIEKEIAELKKSLEILAYKEEYYKTALELGTEKDLMCQSKLPYFEEFLNKK